LPATIAGFDLFAAIMLFNRNATARIAKISFFVV